MDANLKPTDQGEWLTPGLAIFPLRYLLGSQALVHSCEYQCLCLQLSACWCIHKQGRSSLLCDCRGSSPQNSNPHGNHDQQAPPDIHSTVWVYIQSTILLGRCGRSAKVVYRPHMTSHRQGADCTRWRSMCLRVERASKACYRWTA